MLSFQPYRLAQFTPTVLCEDLSPRAIPGVPALYCEMVCGQPYVRLTFNAAMDDAMDGGDEVRPQADTKTRAGVVTLVVRHLTQHLTAPPPQPQAARKPQKTNLRDTGERCSRKRSCLGLGGNVCTCENPCQCLRQRLLMAWMDARPL